MFLNTYKPADNAPVFLPDAQHADHRHTHRPFETVPMNLTPDEIRAMVREVLG